MVTDPKHVTVAKRYVGVAEIVGPKHSPVIMGWINKLSAKVLGTVVNDDETPWCGTFMAEVMYECGYKTPFIAVRASSWDKFGQPLIGPTYGAILRFQRPGGGHVGIAMGKRVVKGKTEYYVLGGNQSNKVGYSWIARDRLISARWPAEIPAKYQGLPVYKADGTKASENEK